jgi:hypothetical protein
LSANKNPQSGKLKERSQAYFDHQSRSVVEVVVVRVVVVVVGVKPHRSTRQARTFCPQVAGVVIDDFWSNYAPHVPSPPPPGTPCPRCPPTASYEYGACVEADRSMLLCSWILCSCFVIQLRMNKYLYWKKTVVVSIDIGTVNVK